ncbi:hypothetical protein MRX96_045070 [Rhipicephalus microplus]
MLRSRHLCLDVVALSRRPRSTLLHVTGIAFPRSEWSVCVGETSVVLLLVRRARVVCHRASSFGRRVALLLLMFLLRPPAGCVPPCPRSSSADSGGRWRRAAFRFSPIQ